MRPPSSDDSSRQLHPIESRSGSIICIAGTDFSNFSSNDYLGLSTDSALIEACQLASTQQIGSTGSRLLSGDHSSIHSLESELALYIGKERALFFNSGYQLNSSVLPTLCNKKDLIITDKLAHASIIDGARLSDARFLRYQHNNMKHLQQLLENHRHEYKNVIIATESLFSMEGDFAPLQQLLELKKKYDCQLYIDEAHALGLYGLDGAGLISAQALSKDIDYIIGTFGKALGSSGAFIACNVSTEQTLINHCRGFIYSTALPHPIIETNRAAIKRCQAAEAERAHVHKLSHSLRHMLQELPWEIRGDSPIIPLITKSSEKSIQLSESLKKDQIWALPIRPPTVPEKEARLRFSITADHTNNQIQALFRSLCLAQ